MLNRSLRFMSVKELLKKSSAEFIDASPVLPEGVRILTREKSACEQVREDRRPSNPPGCI